MNELVENDVVKLWMIIPRIVWVNEDWTFQMLYWYILNGQTKNCFHLHEHNCVNRYFRFYSTKNVWEWDEVNNRIEVTIVFFEFCK